jgi:hypothetical protein
VNPRNTTPPDPTASDPQLAPRDALITRLLDGRAASADWRALRAQTTSDPQMWIELIDISELGEGLGQAVKAAQDQAARVELPTPATAITHEPGRTHTPNHARTRRADRLGWLVAVLLGVGLVTLAVKPRLGTDALSGQARPAAAGFATADEAMNTYLELGKAQGRVVGEVPQRIILESRALPTGGREVLYIRQLIERAIVDDLYKVGTDDQGRPVVVPDTAGTLAPQGF